MLFLEDKVCRILGYLFLAGAVGRSGRFDELLPGYLCSGDVWSLSHFVADPGRSFRAGRFGDWGLGIGAFCLPFLFPFDCWRASSRLSRLSGEERRRGDFCVQTVFRSLLGVFRELVVKRLKLSGQVVIPLRFVVFRKEFCLFREKFVSSFRLQGNADRFLHLS